MTTDAFLWLSGLSLAIGGFLATVGWLLFAILDVNHTQVAAISWLVLNGLIVLGGVFMALGLPGFYGRQAAQSGWLGLFGFVFHVCGYCDSLHHSSINRDGYCPKYPGAYDDFGNGWGTFVICWFDLN